MAWPTGRRRPYSATWVAVCKYTRRRAEWRCEYTTNGVRCERPGKEVDHIIPYFEGGPDTPDNAMLLCGPHHDDKTQAEARRAAEKKRAAGRRPAERHPLDY